MRIGVRVTQFVRQLLRTTLYEARRTKRIVVASETRPRTENPIFIIGVHRSGTTLVRLILDSHSRIACPPESFFLLSLQHFLGNEKTTEGLRAMGFPREQVVERLREFTTQFFEEYVASRGKSRWADKTPAYINCLDLIDTLYGSSARYVLIFRHGLDSACSIAQIPDIEEAEPHISACEGDRYAGAARYWSSNANIPRSASQYSMRSSSRLRRSRRGDSSTFSMSLGNRMFSSSTNIRTIHGAA